MSDHNKKKLIEKLTTIDRRIIYVFLLLAIALPFFLTPVISIKPTVWVQSAYDLIDEAAEKKSAVLIGFDYDPATLAELQPMAEAILRHCFDKGVKVVGINFIPNGTSLAASTLDAVAEEYGKVYGEDYVFLGFSTPYNIVLINIGEDIKKAYSKDFRGNSVHDLPMMKNIQNYDDFHLVIDISGTALPRGYLIYGQSKFNFNYVAGVTAVSATEYFPYLQSGQMKGLLAGMKAAAEYEFLIGKISDGMRGMAPQMWGHLVIIFFIIIGNILYFVKRRMGMES